MTAKLVVDHEAKHRAERLCLSLQASLHNVSECYPDRLRESKRLYRELGKLVNSFAVKVAK